MRIASILGSALLSACAFSQGVQQWMRLYDHADAPEITGAVVCFDDTTYRFASTWSANGQGHIAAMAISQSGDTLWDRGYVSDSIALNPGGAHGRPRADGSWFWAGAAYRDGVAEPDAALVCFSANGDSLWMRAYGTGITEGFNGMCVLPDGGCCLVGVSYDTGTDIYVVRTDVFGDTLWTGVYGGGSNDNAFSVVETQDGGFAIGAFRWINNNDVATLLLKLDANGNFQWQRTYGTPYRDNGCAVAELPDGSLLLATALGIAPVPNLSKRATLIKTDALGVEQWTSTFNDSDYTFLGTTPLPMPNGEIVVSGGRWPSFENIKGMLVRFDANGSPLWERNYTTNVNFDHYIYDLRRTLDGGFIMAGTAFDTVPPLSQDAWLIKTDSFGCLVPGCQVFDAVMEQYTDLIGALQVSPNPTDDVVQVSIELPPGLVKDGELVLTVVDAQGRRVQEEQLQGVRPSHSITLSLGAHPPGMYFLHLTNGTQWLAGSKIIKE